RSQVRVVVGVPLMPQADDAQLRSAYEEAEAEIATTLARVRGASTLPPLDLQASVPPARGASSYAREDFIAHVERIKRYIVEGDAFQVLLARRISVPHDFPSESLYRALRVINPSPYMYHLILDGVELVGSSPELVARGEPRRVAVPQ